MVQFPKEDKIIGLKALLMGLFFLVLIPLTLWIASILKWRSKKGNLKFPFLILAGLIIFAVVRSLFVHFALEFLIILGIFIAGIYFAHKKTSPKFLHFSVIFTSILIYFVFNLLIHQTINYFRLKSLDIHSVEAIEFSSKTITKPDELRKIVEALHNVQWFMNNHKGWSKELKMVIHFRIGKTWEFAIASYSRQRGAVILFGTFKNGKRRMNFGESFCPDLPKALVAIGILL